MAWASTVVPSPPPSAARLEFLELPIMKEKGALETPLASATNIIFGGLGKYHSQFLVTLPRSPISEMFEGKC